MRNIDKINALKHELGRYQKKVADQEKEAAGLRERLKTAEAAILELRGASDAILTAMVLEHGVDAMDEDNPGVVLGKRLEVPDFRVEEMLKRYSISARKDAASGKIVYGLIPREGGV